MQQEVVAAQLATIRRGKRAGAREPTDGGVDDGGVGGFVGGDVDEGDVGGGEARPSQRQGP